MRKIIFISGLVISLIVLGVAIFWVINSSLTNNLQFEAENILRTKETVVIPSVSLAEVSPTLVPVIEFVGPRENISSDAPVAYGFWSFAMPVSGVLSRSGQPLVEEFRWLAKGGWRGDVNLRVDGERGEIGDDAKLPGFNELGFNYLHLPIIDGHPPTDEQAEQFLVFVMDPNNQPVHVHCRGGIGRAGTMVALYRYAVQGWPMDKAIEESRPFQGGISDMQKKWLENWAKNHMPVGEVSY